MAQIQPNCFECKYHFITHQPKRPYGCRRFGFKGPFLPSRMVFQETGMKCAYYEASRRADHGRGPTGSNGRLA
jgi:hypothetical protein